MEGALKMLKILRSSASLTTIVELKGMAWFSVVGWGQRGATELA